MRTLSRMTVDARMHCGDGAGRVFTNQADIAEAVCEAEGGGTGGMNGRQRVLRRRLFFFWVVRCW